MPVDKFAIVGVDMQDQLEAALSAVRATAVHTLVPYAWHSLVYGLLRVVGPRGQCSPLRRHRVSHYRYVRLSPGILPLTTGRLFPSFYLLPRGNRRP